MKSLFTFFICFVALLVSAQDAHFSQLEPSTIFNNPAYVDPLLSQFSIGGVYRSQWKNIPEAYRSYGLQFQHKISKVSWAASIVQNDAGPASLQNTQFKLRLNYQKKLSGQSYLSVGADLGAVQQKFNPDLLTFDNQYSSGVGYDPELSSKEEFANTATTGMDFGVGITYHTRLGKAGLTTGLTLNHLNQPSFSFIEGADNSYPSNMAAFAKISLPLANNLLVSPFVNYQKQKPASNTAVGIGISKQLENKNKIKLAIASRLKDALVIQVGMEVKNLSFDLSYDMNNSTLSEASNGNGAIELSARYYFNANLNVDGAERVEEDLDRVTMPVMVDSPAKVMDRDGDGILDNVDECPAIPGFAKFGGCLDADNDGVWDSRDLCPNLFGDKRNGGCPGKIKDSDFDGLIDEVDTCPYIKGTPEMKGCPDSDKDGISDLEDHCPYLKGVIENEGCPARKNPKYPNDKPNISATQLDMVTVYFDTDLALISRPDYNLLDDFIESLMENPDTEIMISGHTDGEGDRVYNYKLGERRANAVYNYLLQNGIPKNRIRTISYGESLPVDSNVDDNGKALNRRVEAMMVQ